MNIILQNTKGQPRTEDYHAQQRKNMILSAAVSGMVGFKDGEFIQEISGPGIEPWFVVYCIMAGGEFDRIFTKDAKSYCDATAYYSTGQSWLSVRHFLLCEVCEPRHEQFLSNERILVKEAIGRYVGDLVERNQ